MSIQDVQKEGMPKPKAKLSDDFEIPEVDIRGLFIEPEITGVLAKVLPWVNIGILFVLLVKLMFFK